jgi:tRNA dimethylallyltransferase
MQMYKGLPIVTNKISEEEKRGIPHHLLGSIGLDEQPWVVGVFKREASKIIREIRSRGRLPIIAGGSHYYTNGLLFEDALIEDAALENAEASEDHDSKLAVLDASTEEILQHLREVDPVMAARWHPSDRRKIRRSLEIFLKTGRRASDIYAEQQDRTQKSPEDDEPSDPWPVLCLWVYSQPEALKERLDKRVDDMLENGLLAETAEMHRYLQDRIAAGETVDLSYGIWQSIGFKDFEPYHQALEADPPVPEDELARLKQAGVESTQAATRRYAKYQVRWITMKTLPLLRNEGALDSLYLLDSTDLGQWKEEVLAKGTELTRQFLAGEELPSAQEVSKIAEEVLSSKIEQSNIHPTKCNRFCEVCNVTSVTEEQWAKHVKGRRHQRAVRAAKKKALVVAPTGVATDEEP